MFKYIIKSKAGYVGANRMKSLMLPYTPEFVTGLLQITLAICTRAKTVFIFFSTRKLKHERILIKINV